MAQDITFAGEKLFATQAQLNQALDIDTFIFANVPGQDASTAIDRNEGLPPVAQRVHTQAVQQKGKINDNIVVYSTVLESITGPFEFNWVGLYSSVHQTLIAVQHIPTVNKTTTVGGAAGNTLNRNFGIQYSGIAALTNITVDAQTWQLDFSARLEGVDRLHRQLAREMNGDNWFTNQNFQVFHYLSDTFKVNAGFGYVYGLRVELNNHVYLTADSYPQNVYIDAWFDGDASSTWKPQHEIVMTNQNKSNYVDENGKQHLVLKIAVINGADDVEDLRGKSGISQKLEEHENSGGHIYNQIDWSQSGLDSEDVASVTLINKSLGYSAGGNVVKNIDAYEMLRNKKSFAAIGVDESGSLSAEYSYNKLDGIGVISTTPNLNHSWMAIANGFQWVKVKMPHAVVIGDSIAEGHPDGHGRLHQSYEEPTFNDVVINAYGTPAFELSRRTGIHWFNHGIGGQNTTQILERFERDALAKVESLNDGMPNQTLPGKPVVIWVNAGINDVSQGVHENTTKENLLKMALLAKSAGVMIGFNTIGPVNSHDQEQNDKQDSINKFILTMLPIYGAKTFDFKTWFADENDRTKVKSFFSDDGVHPNKTGYTNMVSSLLESNDLPIYLNGVWLETAIGESISSNFRIPTEVEFLDERDISAGNYLLTDIVQQINPNIDFTTSPFMKVKIKNVYGGLDSNMHSGFSAIKANVGYKSTKDLPYKKDKEIYGGHIAKKPNGLWGLIETTSSNGVGQLVIYVDHIEVRFSDEIVNPQVCCIGSTSPIHYSVSGLGENAKSCNVWLFDILTGELLNPSNVSNNSGFSISAWSN